MLTLDAELMKLVLNWLFGLKRLGDGDRNPPCKAIPNLPGCLLIGWYEGIIDPISSKLLLWLLSFVVDAWEMESSSSETLMHILSNNFIQTMVINTLCHFKYLPYSAACLRGSFKLPMPSFKRLQTKTFSPKHIKEVCIFEILTLKK